VHIQVAPERLFDFIAEEDPARARKQVLSVHRALEPADHPLLGREAEEGRRELILSRGRYGYIAKSTSGPSTTRCWSWARSHCRCWKRRSNFGYEIDLIFKIIIEGETVMAMRSIGVVIATAVALATVVPGIATDDMPAFAEAQGAELQEIVVTATKRSESLQEVPLSITAITAQAIERAGSSISSTMPSKSPI